MKEHRKMKVQKKSTDKDIVARWRYLVVCGRRRIQIEMETLNGNLSSETNFPVVQMANLKEVPVFQ